MLFQRLLNAWLIATVRRQRWPVMWIHMHYSRMGLARAASAYYCARALVYRCCHKNLFKNNYLRNALGRLFACRLQRRILAG